jgi:hypothetical protein
VRGAPTKASAPIFKVDVLAGLALIVIAAFGAVLAWDLPIGSAARMGPGFLPLVLLAVLAGLGIVTAVIGLVRTQGLVAGWPLRAFLLIPAAMLVFGLLVERAGLLMASAASVIVAAAASSES